MQFIQRAPTKTPEVVKLQISKEEEPKDKIKKIDSVFLTKIRSDKPNFNNKDVTDFIKNKISYINEVDDF